MTEQMDGIVAGQLAKTEARVATLTALSGELDAVLEAHAAFYVLRAAAAVSGAKAHLEDVKRTAMRRRTGLVPGSEVHEGYTALIDEIDRFVDGRTPWKLGLGSIWAYGWASSSEDEGRTS
jgi:hypothetical protein